MNFPCWNTVSKQRLDALFDDRTKFLPGTIGGTAFAVNIPAPIWNREEDFRRVSLPTSPL